MVYLLEYTEVGPEAVLQLENSKSVTGEVVVALSGSCYHPGFRTKVMSGQGWYKYRPLTDEEVLIYKMGR
jgi:hypothetical protein